MNELQSEIESRLTSFFQNWERYDIKTDRNPFYRGEAEQALKIAAQLAQVEQAAQLKRIADTLSNMFESPVFG